jgi:hypothetical protein
VPRPDALRGDAADVIVHAKSQLGSALRARHRTGGRRRALSGRGVLRARRCAVPDGHRCAPVLPRLDGHRAAGSRCHQQAGTGTRTKLRARGKPARRDRDSARLGLTTADSSSARSRAAWPPTGKPYEALVESRFKTSMMR